MRPHRQGAEPPARERALRRMRWRRQRPQLGSRGSCARSPQRSIPPLNYAIVFEASLRWLRIRLPASQLSTPSPASICHLSFDPPPPVSSLQPVKFRPTLVTDSEGERGHPGRKPRHLASEQRRKPLLRGSASLLIFVLLMLLLCPQRARRGAPQSAAKRPAALSLNLRSAKREARSVRLRRAPTSGGLNFQLSTSAFQSESKSKTKSKKNPPRAPRNWPTPERGGSLSDAPNADPQGDADAESNDLAIAEAAVPGTSGGRVSWASTRRRHPGQAVAG